MAEYTFRIKNKIPNNAISGVSPYAGTPLTQEQFNLLGIFQDRVLIQRDGRTITLEEYRAGDPEEVEDKPAEQESKPKKSESKEQSEELNLSDESAETDLEELEMQELRDLFEQKFNTTAAPNIKRETLISKLREA